MFTVSGCSRSVAFWPRYANNIQPTNLQPSTNQPSTFNQPTLNLQPTNL
ncbi:MULTISPECIES: hypothetical protein [unclassified Moorena]|nr:MULTISPECIES: hypothetical protein [unclassified Moorena]NEO11390.1 hypothetical protein [Moorena sp. SIO3E8]NEP99227.1 hypothetical protein [Moorena sp. SIO3F7]